MLNVPTGITLANYINALHHDCPSHIRITFTGQNVVLTDADIESSGLVLQDLLNGDTDLTFGRAVMATVQIPILNKVALQSLDWSGECEIEIGIEVSGTTYWSSIGLFTGTRPERIQTVDVINFEASDRMQKFDVLAGEWLATLTYPMTFEDLYHDLCTYIGLQYVAGDELPDIMSRSYSNAPVVNTGVTCRDILALMAEACGCYARITYDGKVQMVWYTDHTSDYTVRADDQFALEHNDFGNGVPVIDGVSVKQTEDDVGGNYPSIAMTGNIYMIVDNPYLVITQNSDITTYVKPIYDRLDAFGGYLPIKTEVVGNPLVQSGDIINIKIDGNDYALPIFVRTMHWNGAVTDSYESTGLMQRDTVRTGIKEKLTQGGKYHKYKVDLDALYSELYDASTGDITLLNQTMSQIQLSVAHKPSIFYDSVAPTGTVQDPLQVGDLWIDTAHNNQTMRWDGSAWGDASFDDPDKYTVRSGIAITANGVEVTGGKYVRIQSGGVFEVDATNFKIDSTNKLMQAGNWQLNDNGIKWEDEYYRFTLKHIDVSGDDYVWAYFENISMPAPMGVAMDIAGNLIPYTNEPSNPDLGSSSRRWATGYFTDINATNINVTNKPWVSGPGSSVNNRVAVFDGTGGKTIKDSGYTIEKSVPSNAVFTDHYAWSDITGKPSSFTPSDHTHNKVVIAGTNTSSTKSSDFALNGINVRWFTATGKVPGQPAQYGFLLTLATGDASAENHQIWATQANGDLYHRGTNGSSYTSPPGFKTILDSANYTSYCPTKTGSGASGTWGINVTGSAGSVAWANVTGKPTIPDVSGKANWPAWGSWSTWMSQSQGSGIKATTASAWYFWYTNTANGSNYIKVGGCSFGSYTYTQLFPCKAGVNIQMWGQGTILIINS